MKLTACLLTWLTATVFASVPFGTPLPRSAALDSIERNTDMLWRTTLQFQQTGSSFLVSPMKIQGQKLIDQFDATTTLYKSLSSGQKAKQMQKEEAPYIMQSAKDASDSIVQVAMTLKQANKRFKDSPFGAAIMHGIVKTAQGSLQNLTDQIIASVPGNTTSSRSIRSSVNKIEHSVKMVIEAYAV